MYPLARSSELASFPSAPHPLLCGAVAGQLSTGLSGSATQDRWRGIILASQRAMVAVVGAGWGELSHSPHVCIHTHSQMHVSTYSSPLLPQTQPNLLLFMR